jgi:toxin ParE1/3/4
MEIVWTRQALSDLGEIEHYIQQERPRAAERVAMHLLSSVEHLGEFPELGRPGPRPGTRSVIIPPYVISYRVRHDRVEVLSVWHGRRRR